MGRDVSPQPSPAAAAAPHSPVYASLLCVGPCLQTLTQVHAHLVIFDLHHRCSLLTKLLTLTVSSGNPHYAHFLLPFVPNPDPFLFDSIIRSSSHSPLPLHHSIHFYLLMLSSSLTPSIFTFTPLLKSCTDLSAAVHGCTLHGHAHALAAGFGPDRFIETSLILFNAKGGDLFTTHKVFDRMPNISLVTTL